LGERLLCKQEVIGSIPFTSTNDFPARNHYEESIAKLRKKFSYEFFTEEFIGCFAL
jgi:hypothetical protein